MEKAKTLRIAILWGEKTRTQENGGVVLDCLKNRLRNMGYNNINISCLLVNTWRSTTFMTVCLGFFFKLFCISTALYNMIR